LKWWQYLCHVASEGIATVYAEILEGEDLQKISQDVKSKIDGITTFPKDAEEPQITTMSLKHKTVTFVIYGDVSHKTLYELSEEVRDTLLGDPNITQVEISGIRNLQITIEVPQENLRRYNLTLQDVANAIDRASTDLPAGGIKTKGGEILIKVDEKKEYGDQFARIPIITTNDGNHVFLEDIATITDGFEDSDYYATYNNQPAAMIVVNRVGRQTPLEVADAVYKHLENFKTTLPQGVSTDIIEDNSILYRDRVSLLVRNGGMGLILVFCVLGLFLELRLAFWVMMGIPISFMGSLLVLPLIGVSINMVSLFAYIMTLGIVVDDAIVAGENIYHNKQRGMPMMEAAILGAKEVMMPVTFSILTNITAFLPLFFIPGVMGKIFVMIPAIVVTVFIISLVESLFVLPSHLAHSKNEYASKWLHDKQQIFSHWFTNWVRTKFAPFLEGALKRKYLTISIAFSVLIIFIAFIASGRIGMTFFPKVESEFAVVVASLPYGTSVEKTEALKNKLLQSAKKVASKIERGDELLEGTFAIVGLMLDGEGKAQKSGSNYLTVYAYMADADIRADIMSTDEFTNLWREEFGEMAGIEYIKFKSDFGGPGGGTAIAVELNHRDIDVLKNAGKDLADELGKYSSTSDINDGFEKGKQQLNFIINDKGKALGLTAKGVALQVRNAIYGSEVLRQQRKRSELKVMVRFPEDERISEYTIEEMIIRTPKGQEVPLTDVVEVRRDIAYTSINRTNGRRQIQVTADVVPIEEATNIVADINKSIMPDLMKKYKGLNYNFEGKQADQQESMEALVKGFVIALLGIFILLSLPFQCYVQPVIVMASIPFGIVGAVIGHLIMGFSLSVVSMLGLVALSGVVVNDSLVLIEFANRMRKDRGWNAFDAALAAGVQRFRPIILTTLTTFFGLMPMIFETDFSTRFLVPMAISLGFGILFVTFVTLIFVPCLYVAVEDLKSVTGETKRAFKKWRKL